MTTLEAPPDFRHHPGPLWAGTVVASHDECRCCERARGYLYAGPVFAVEELADELCPWCISDGSAAEMFDASFTGIGWGVPDNVSDDVLEIVAKRTPGFTGWQQEH